MLMKKSLLSILSMAAIFGMASCQKTEPAQSVSEGYTFALRAETDHTRTSYDGLKVDWEDGDVIYVVTEDGVWDGSTQATYTYAKAEGQFSSTSTITGEHTFRAMYGAADQKKYHSSAGTTYKLLAAQNQDCNNPTAHLKVNDALFGSFTASLPLSTPASVTMKHIFTVMRVDVKNETGEDLELKSFEMSADKTLAGIFNVSFNTDGSVGISEKSGQVNTITVNLTNGTVAAGNSLPVYFVMAPLSNYSGNVTFTVMDSNDKVYTKSVNLSGKSFEAGKLNTTSYAISTGVSITYDHAGTADDPYSVADVLKYISTLGSDASTVDVYAKGIISSISSVSTSYGNATYKIKDNGVDNELTIYQGLYLDGAKFTSADQIKVGDEVVVVGKVKSYNGTDEFDKGNKIVKFVSPYLYATATKTTVAAAGETVAFSVICNIDGWTASSSDDANFAISNKTDNGFDVVVAENTATAERSATITISAGEKSKTITLTQTAEGVKTYKHIFNKKPDIGENVDLSGVAWNISATKLGNYNSGNYAGVQFGTKSENGQITLTSPSDWSYTADGVTVTKIKEVRLWLNMGGTSVTPSVTIGGKAATSDGTTVVKNSNAVLDWTKTTKVTFTPASDGNTGVIVIDVTSVKAGYICAMEIDAE